MSIPSQPVYVSGDYARLLADATTLVAEAPLAPFVFTDWATLFARRFDVIRGTYVVSVKCCFQIASPDPNEVLPVADLALFVDSVQQAEGAEYACQEAAAPRVVANFHFTMAFDNVVAFADGGRMLEVKWRAAGAVPTVSLDCRPVSFPGEEGCTIAVLRIGS